MLKHLAHSHHKLHSFDDFYNENNSKIIKSSNDLLSTTTNNHSSSPIATSGNLACSPNNSQYTFYNIFSDFKSSTTPNDVIEEEEINEEQEDKNAMKCEEHESASSTPVFYLEDDHHNHSQLSPSSVSPHWPSLIFNRFRHPNSHHTVNKQLSVNENNSHSAKMRKSEFSDVPMNKRRFIKRSATLSNTDSFNEKKSSNDDFPQLFAATSQQISTTTDTNTVKKHRSIASLFHHFHHNSLSSNSNKSNSTDSLHRDNSNSNFNNKTENQRPKLLKQKTLPSNIDDHSPVKKSPSTPILPKLVSLFHRHHQLSEHHKYRVGNLKARLHHRRNSPPLNNNTPKFQCQVSTELIRQVQQAQQLNEQDIYSQRPNKPVIMKRVHTWHNTFDLRPLDQCLEY